MKKASTGFIGVKSPYPHPLEVYSNKYKAY